MITAFVMLIIPAIAYIALRSPAVQTYIAGKAAEYLSRELDAKISVGGVNITYSLNIVLEKVEIQDKENAHLLSTQRIVVDIKRFSWPRRFLAINKILFDQASLSMVMYEGKDEHNFQFLVDYFSREETNDTLRLPAWDVMVRSFEFKDASLYYANHNQQLVAQGFDSNNFSFDNLNIDVVDIFFEKDTLQAELSSFSFDESRGFQLTSARGDLFFSSSGAHLQNFEAVTNQSQLLLNFAMVYEGYHAFQNITEDIGFTLDIKPSLIDLYEIGYFAEDYYGLEGKVDLAGSFSGKINNMRGNNIRITYGTLTEFAGNFNFVGLPNIEETFVNLSVEKLVTHKADLESFRLPYSFSAPHLNLPVELNKLGIITFSGNFTGFMHDFVAFGQFNSRLGQVNTDIAILAEDNFKEISYSGNIATKNFNLKQLLDNHEEFGSVSLSSYIEGSGYNLDNLDVAITGEIQSIDFRGYDYRQLKVDGNYTNRRFNGNILIDDPNLFLDFGGIVDFGEQTPLLNFTAQVENANLSKLNIYQRDALYQSIVSTTIHVNGSGSNIGNIQGEVNAYSTSYTEKPLIESEMDTITYHSITTDVIALENLIRADNSKQLRFYSDFLDFQIEGELHFEKMASSLSQFVYHYIPSWFKEAPSPLQNGSSSDQVADFNIHVKNMTELLNVFLPQVQIAPHSYFNGTINTGSHELFLTGSSDFMVFANTRLHQPEISINSDIHTIDFVTRGEKLFLTDSIWMEQFFTSANISNDSIILLTQWENKGTEKKNLGSIKARGLFLSPQTTELSILTSYAFVNDSLWTIRPDNRIMIDSSYISIDNFFLYKNEEHLLINGVLSDNPEDVLNIGLNHFNLESLRFLLGDRKIDFAGYASGELKLSNLQQAPNIFVEILVREFAFNNDHLGDLSLESRWDALEKAFRINAEVIYYGNVGYNKPIVANGYFYPEREEDNFDIDIVIENLKMSILSRYMEAFASNFRGLASGRLRLEGPTSEPELTGTARLVRTGFRVDYLNTSYSFAHGLEVGKDYFRFDNLIINDTIGNSALASGIIRHNNFQNFSLDITLMPERLVVLNTLPHHNELFYGRAFASGIARVHGPVEDITIDISATVNRGTQFFLPLDFYGELTESSFISFVAPDADKQENQPFTASSNPGFAVNLDISVTPEAEIQIIFDSQIGDILRGRGFGDLKVEIDNQGFFNMYGDYTIQEGDYLFTLQNLINKRFRIEQGGTIRWTGDPYDADIDIRALYRLRTSLHDLAVNQADTSDIYKRRVPVETVLHLQDKLFNPTLSFDIQFPGSDESTREMTDRIITTEQEMNRQVFSLLILNRFVPPEGGFNNALSYGMGSTSSELLSNQLSNWLSQISSDFDIGINYRPGDEISSQEIEVALSTQLFDDRVVIDGNVGVAGDHPAQTHRASNIIGDVNVEVKITPEGKFRIKAFNRSNTFDVLNTNAPYTQGVGVFYRKEFDSLTELFQRNRRTLLEIPEMEDLESMQRE